ncbi:MAG: hypothetical protein CMJ89_17100 [Planctomycetes bacterium]|nr:hypothetical protein [Planctomycetota bacterium]
MGIPRQEDDVPLENRSGSRGEAGASALRAGLLAMGFSAFTYLTLRGLGQAHLFGDEFHSVRNLGHSFGELAGLYDAFGSGLLLPLAQKIAVDLAGAGLWAYRAPSLLGGFLALLLCYPCARRLVGPAPAALVTLALGSSPSFIFYTRYGRGYALASLFALFLAYALLRLGEDSSSGRRRLFWAASVAVSGALLPYAHLFSASSALSIGAAGWIGIEARRGTLQHPVPSRRPILLALAAAALLSVLLHLPAWETLWDFLDKKALAGAGGEFGPGDVATILYGNRGFGWIALGALPMALFVLWRRDPRRAFFLGSAALGPALVLCVARPPGLAYAYARYLLPSLPFQWMLIAWLAAYTARILLKRHATESVTLLGGALLLAALYFAGPLPRTGRGPFANSNLALTPLEAFDAPWPRRSKFYGVMEETREDVTLIEAPELWNRSGLLHRSAWLQHGKNIVVGFVWEQRPERVPGGPYVDLNDRDALASVQADYLVFHKNIYEELTNYWAFVWNQVWPKIENARSQAFMDAHSQYGFVKQRFEPLRALENRLRKDLGLPAFEDHLVVVWDLSRR